MMSGSTAAGDTPEVGLTKLLELYISTQDRLRSTMGNCLDSGEVHLAERLDDVLMRQGFWEDDIHVEDGALVDLEAYDRVASSIIRGVLDEINGHLDEIDNSLSAENRTGSRSSRETSVATEEMSLLCEMNTRLCDQVEIFHAIAAYGAAEHGRKASEIGQLRRQLEEEDHKLHSYPSDKVFAPIQNTESEEASGSAAQRRVTNRRDNSAKAVIYPAQSLAHDISPALAVSSSHSAPPPSEPKSLEPLYWSCGHCGGGPNSMRFDMYCVDCARLKDDLASVFTMTRVAY
ncbi:hypothetical protein BDR22DRAFT_352539 [Usnea florida]